jgi:DNA-binding GntR family transcriptional regulator
MKQVERVPDLRSQIYERLRIAIRGGEYAPGTRLLENDVAKDLGVSRTPAREALALLTQDGLLVHEGRRFKVPVFDERQITEVFEIRQRLEPYAVRLACERATAAELKALRTMADDALSKPSSVQEYLAVNLKLRQALFPLGKNKRLEEAIHLYDELVHYVRLKTLSVEANRQLSVKGWKKLISAVTARKADVAEEAMSHLLDLAERLMLETLAQQGAAAAAPSSVPTTD